MENIYTKFQSTHCISSFNAISKKKLLCVCVFMYLGLCTLCSPLCLFGYRIQHLHTFHTLYIHTHMYHFLLNYELWFVCCENHNCWAVCILCASAWSLCIYVCMSYVPFSPEINKLTNIKERPKKRTEERIKGTKAQSGWKRKRVTYAPNVYFIFHCLK